MASQSREKDVNRLLADIAKDVRRLPPRSAPSTRRLNGIAGEDLYEAYLFMRVLSAARQRGVFIYLLGERSRQQAREIIFRRSPGTLHRASSSASDYTFALLHCPGSDLRALFVGIQARGFSGVTHECDLLLLPFSEAVRAQRDPDYPLYRRADLYVEAKFHSKEITLPTARALIGVHIDLMLGAVVLACHNGIATKTETYLKAGPWRSAVGFGDVRPASPGHKQLEAHFKTLL